MVAQLIDANRTSVRMNLLHKSFLSLLFVLLPFSVMANEFDVAHLREQGQDMIVIPLSSSVQYKSNQQRNELMYVLQRCASSAGLAGTVVIVWDNGGRTMFMAPQQWQSFFRSIDMLWIAKNINRTLTCR
jgi:hypothetical protein